MPTYRTSGCNAAPDRRLVSDVNDFDETAPGPFEWDVKRLAASVVVVVAASGLVKKQSARAAAVSAEGYRTTLAVAAVVDPLDVWYFRLELERARATGRRRRRSARGASKQIAAARTVACCKNRLGALAKLTEDGRRSPSGSVTGPRSSDDSLPNELESELHRVGVFFAWYLESVTADRRHLLLRYRVADLGVEVVGVGSA